MNRNIVVGLVFIALGTILIIQRTIGIDINIWNFIWPLFLIIPGIAIHIKYFSSRTNPGGLAIGGILLTYGIFFLFNVATNGVYQEQSSFVYPLGIGIGFFESFIFGDKKNSNLTVAIIFIVISVYMFLRQVLPEMYQIRDYIIPVLLIILGVYVLFKSKK